MRTPKEQWLRILNSVLYPDVVLTLLVGLVCTYFAHQTLEPSQLNQIFLWFSAIAIGAGVNLWTRRYFEANDRKKLEQIAEYNVRNINLLIESVIDNSQDSKIHSNDLTLVRGLINLMDYWKNYYEFADVNKINEYKDLIRKIDNAKDQELKNKLIEEKDRFEQVFTLKGVTSFASSSMPTPTPTPLPLNWEGWGKAMEKKPRE